MAVILHYFSQSGNFYRAVWNADAVCLSDAWIVTKR